MSQPQQMSPDQIRAHFPRASQSVIEANAGFAFQPQIVSPAETAKVQSARGKLRKPKEPNAAEAEYGLILDVMKRRGEIADYKFEGISLRWADGLYYTADFTVFTIEGKIKFIEIKGRQNKAIRRRDDAIVRFKGARAEWKTKFEFEMWEKSRDGWCRID